ETLCMPRMGLGDILLGRRIAEEPHRSDRPPHGAADEVDQRHAGGATGEVEEGELDRGMGAAVAGKGSTKFPPQRRWLPGILTDEQRCQIVAHRAREPGEGVAGHGRGRGGLAPANRAVAGLDANQDVEGTTYRAASHGYGLAQWQADRDGVDPTDDQGL